MPRKIRKYGNSGLNHCIIRGINKCDIFFDDNDRKKFLYEVKEYKEKYNIKIGAYVLMQNHVHLVTKSEGNNLSKFFQSIQIAYSAYFNKKYERVGHLFQNRYRNKTIENAEYLKNLIKYIHFNPEKAGIGLATEYKWSSYKEFLYDEKIIDKKMILSYYSDNVEEAIEIFAKEHSQKLDGYYSNYTIYEMINRLTDDQVKYIINEIEEKMDNSKKDIWDNNEKNQIIKELTEIEGISVAQISRVTGINVKAINKIKQL